MWISIKKIIPAIAERLGYRGEVEIYQIRSLWPDLMADFYGEMAKKINLRPLYLKNKTLVVNCPDSVWAYDLQMKQELLLKRINRCFQEKKVEKIRFVY